VNTRTLRWLMSLMRPGDGVSANGHARVARLTILRHHRVYGDGERPLYRLGVAESVLADQIALLHSMSLGPLSVAAGLEWLSSGEHGHRVALSFDDGYADNVHRAVPLLRRAGVTATFYLTAGLIEERRAPWWDVLAHALEATRSTRLRWAVDGAMLDLPLEGWSARVRALKQLLPCFRVVPSEQSERLTSLRAALQVTAAAPCMLGTWEELVGLRDAGMEIGAHTMNHPYLSLLSPAQQAREIGDSVERIEERLDVRPIGLAYPGGDHDAASITATGDAGLSYAVTTRSGDNQAFAPRYQLRRRGLYEGACLGPGGRFSRRLALAELGGAFDRLRGVRAEVRQ
jgi:peptidoglycan/xylan/chitin deacetylase (PgdA/CDA1 family)